MIDMKQSELDKMCDDFEKMKFKAGTWWPTIEEIKKNIEPNIKSRMPFAIWITETADEPKTEEEKASRKYLLRLIYDKLNVIDDTIADEEGNDA